MTQAELHYKKMTETPVEKLITMLAVPTVISMLISNLYNQVRDLEFDTPPILATGVSMSRAWEEFQQYPTIAAVPVARENGTLYGILSRTDIASYNMSGMDSGVLEDVPLFNVLSVLEGKVLNEAGEDTDTISGEVTIALPQEQEKKLLKDVDRLKKQPFGSSEGEEVKDFFIKLNIFGTIMVSPLFYTNCTILMGKN